MRVCDHMSIHPVTVRQDADYKIALKLMQDYSLHHIPVLDLGHNLVGIVTERDLLLAAMQYLQSAIEVSEVMHRNVITATPEMGIAEAAALLANNKIGGLPVVDRLGCVIGVITETDILRAFTKVLKNCAHPESVAAA